MGKAKRVLIYRIGSLGDTLVAIPSLHLVARAFPDAERRLLTNFPVSAKAAPAAGIIGASGLVSGYFRYAVGTRSVVELARLWWTLQRWKPDVLVYLGPARGVKAAERDARFFRLCGIREQIGVPVTAGMQGNFFGAASGAGLEDWEPEAARLARNIVELGDARLEEASSWDLKLTAAEREAAAKAVGAEAMGMPRIAVSIGTKVQTNDWGAGNWTALLGRLAEARPGYALLLAGAAGESEASEAITVGWRTGGGGPVVNLCGKLSPRESAAAFAGAKVYAGHDSGPMHLAAAMQVPCVAIFSARNVPRVWFPYGAEHWVLYRRVDCMGCGLETCVVEKKKCILGILVEEVFEEVVGVLGGSGQWVEGKG